MFDPKRRPFAAILVAAALLLTYAAPAAAAPQQTADQKKEEPKKEEKPKLTKQEKKYQDIKRFSNDLYAKDADFRDTVDDAYRLMLREHAEFAYEINTSNGRDRVNRDGDRVKVYDTLYDNPLAQDYVNRLGQSLVPADSTRLYAFKITLNPIPEARSLAAGTLYVSSRVLSLVDNEAQLAYILGHEIGHVEHDHWADDVLVSKGIIPYNEKQEKKRAIWGAVLGAGVAGLTGLGG